ncbi:hypothetical protein OG612_44980 (plasmid) [Streptomyces sp. NBC_01527]|uniref:hypothetical protein n=1 Tax=Streptomyces sp. NBC_01527 TaxID=2903894 RepID=UPI003864ABC1
MAPYITTSEGELAETLMAPRVTIDLFGFSTFDYRVERPGDQDADRGGSALAGRRVAGRTGGCATPLGSTRCGSHFLRPDTGEQLA